MSSTDLRGQATQFVESVLELNPAVAVFDCDGTLWSGDAGRDFFYWEIERCFVSPDVGQWARARHREYLAGRVSEERMCSEMVTMNRGLSYETLQNAAAEFYDEVVMKREFPEMHGLIRRLGLQGCDVWAVSSTNHWVVEVGAKRFGIAPDHVLAACVHVDDGRVTDRLIRVPTDDLKALAIRQVVGKPVDAVFGNSVHDQAMLEMAKHPFCVNPTSELEQVARERGWSTYWTVGS